MLLAADGCSASSALLGLTLTGPRLALEVGANSSVLLPVVTPFQITVGQNFTSTGCSGDCWIPVANFSDFPSNAFSYQHLVLQVGFWSLCTNDPAYPLFSGLPLLITSKTMKTSTVIDNNAGQGDLLVLSAGIHYTSTTTDLEVQTGWIGTGFPGTSFCLCRRLWQEGGSWRNFSLACGLQISGLAV